MGAKVHTALRTDVLFTELGYEACVTITVLCGNLTLAVAISLDRTVLKYLIVSGDIEVDRL